MKKNFLIQILLVLYIIFLAFNKYIQLFSLPISLYILFLLLILTMILYKNISLFDLFLLLWIMIAIISMIINNNLEKTKSFLSLVTNISSYYIICKLTLKNKNYINDCFIGAKISTMILLFTSIYEIITKKHIMILSLDYARRFFGIPVAFYSNANDLASTLVCLIVVLTVELIYSKGKISTRSKVLNLLLIFACMIVIYFTNSLICFTAMIAIHVLYILFKKYFASKNKPLLFLIVIILLFLILYSLNSSSEYLNSFDPIYGRLDIWQAGIKLLNNHWIFGIGPGQTESLGVGQMHFLFLEILINYGLIIFCVFTLKYLYELKKVIKNINCFKNQHVTNTSIFIFVFYLLLLILSICSSSMTKLYLSWVCISICVSIANLKEEL